MMRRRGRGRAIFCVIAAIALGITINTQAIAEDDGETAEPNADEVSASEPVVEPYVERLLNDVGEYIGAAQAFTFEADVTYEEATDEGRR
ncbi:MAG: hypothetical protein IH897_14780 [Planctomycetes bacterium]|nr:hypothetical protein [Planctomycetota bacterium]